MDKQNMEQSKGQNNKQTDNGFEDITLDKNLKHIANMEASTDIIVEDDALLREAMLYDGQLQSVNGNSQTQGVTSNAPYKNIAKYKMITGEFADDLGPDPKADGEMFDSQGS